MTKRLKQAGTWAFAAAASLCPFLADAEPSPLFTPPSASERLPRAAALSVASDGTFRVNGMPRYLTATVFYGNVTEELSTHTSGYPASLNWLYEAAPGYEEAQRLGLDAIGFEAGRLWMRTFSSASGLWQASGCLPSDPSFARVMDGQLPAYVDFTPAEWGHGGLRPKLAPGLPKEAWTVGDNHWVPYSIHHPAGRDIWLTMWREETKRLQSAPVRPWCYELMNEPMVLDRGAYAKARFAETGRRDHPVEYLKYNDERFADLVAEGVRAIKSVQPDARVTLQPCTTRAKGIDLYALSRKLDVICAPTGGAGLIGGHMMRALADGKPIVDGETYVGTSASSVRNSLISQYARGFNASYTFKWSRRPRDWARGGDAAKEAPLARKVAAYNLLNPYVFPTEAFAGYRLARREAQLVGDLFLPRDRGTPRRVAVLYSRPTERLWHCFPNKVSLLAFEKTLEQLDYAHLNPDVIFEEQLRDDPSRLDRYAVLVAPGVEAVSATTPSVVRAWQAKGGRLVLVDERMAADEYGQPNGETYPGAEFVASIGIQAEELGARLTRLAAEAGVRPSCRIEDDDRPTGAASRIEVTDASRDGLRGWIVLSHAPAPKLVSFQAERKVDCLLSIRCSLNSDGRVIAECRPLAADATGAVPLYLEPGDARILVAGPRTALLARWPASDDTVWMEPLSAEAARADGLRRLAEHRAARQAKKGGYHPEVSRTHSLDLRRLANERQLTDKWWGVREVEGVPFDFIRTDQNSFKDVVKVSAADKPVSVDVHDDVQHLYLNYSGSPFGEVVYEDGSKACFDLPAGVSGARRTGRWTNPRPLRRVATFTFGSRSDVSVLAAVTVERPAPGLVPLDPENMGRLVSRSGPRLVPRLSAGEIRLVHGEQPASWSCASLTLRTPLAPPSGKCRLMMEVNALTNRFGAKAAHPALQVNLEVLGADGRKVMFDRYRQLKTDDGCTEFRQTDDDPLTWETVQTDVDFASFGRDAVVTGVNLQYKRVGTDPGALAVRNLRLVSVGGMDATPKLPTGCPDFTIELPRPKVGPVVRAVDFGLSETNRLNGAAIQRALAAAKRAGAKRLELAPGRYLCHDAVGIVIEGFEDFVFDGAGAELVFYRPPLAQAAGKSDAEGSSPSFLLKDCTRVRFGNLSVDWDWEKYPLASFARVVGSHVDERDNASYLDFEFTDYARHPFYPNVFPVQTIMAMKPTRDGFSTGFGSCYFGQNEGHTGAKSEWLAPNRIRIWPHVKPDDPRATVLEPCLRHYTAKLNRGMTASLAKAEGMDALFRLAHCYYGKGAFKMDSCAHLTMKDIRIRSAFGMGFVTAGSQHHWQIVDVDIAPPPGVRRPITVTADAHHVVNSCGWAKVERFSVTMNQDDLSNFHDCVSAAKRIAPKTLAFTHRRGNAYFKAKAGDEIELRQFNYEATGLLAKIVEATDERLVLDRDVPSAKYESYMLFNRSFATDHLILRDCSFSNCTGRCCFMGNDVTVENCRFAGLMSTPLKFQAAFMLTAWAEGHGCTNVVVRGCTFEDCQRRLEPAYGKTVAETFVGRNLRISYEAGGFDLPTSYGIVSGILFDRNRWIRPRAPIVQVFCAEKVTFRDNAVELGEIADGRCLPDRGKIVIERSRQVDAGGLATVVKE